MSTSDTTGLTPKQRFLKLARDRFKQATEADEKQRQRELDDLRFYAGDQWPDEIKRTRAGLTENNDLGLPPVPARPCVTINKTREPVRTVLNQERGADIGIELVPADDFGDLTGPIDETEITLREGLVRRIQRESHAADARTWAFARGTIAGRGYYGVMTRYAPGKTFDKEIYIHRFYNQASVVGDPAQEQPDGSDAEFWFVGVDVPWHRYIVEHPTRNGNQNRITSLSDDEWRALGDEQPDWFKGDGETRSVRVVDYYYAELASRTLCQMPDGSAQWKDELPDGAPTPIDEREVVERTIKWAKIDGCDDDVLQETDWEGPDMPIIKVLGEELQPYDKERRAEGMVRPMREPGQSYNVMVSKMVEMIGLTPMPSLMVAEGQDEGYEEWYNAANTRTLPKLPYKQTDLEGRPAPPPFSVPREAPIGPVTQAIAMFDDALQSVSVSDPATGHTDSSVKSAKHAGMLREQATQSTSNYIDNLMRSMRYEGQVVNNLLYPIYGKRPGRIARIVNGQGEPETLIIGQPMLSQGGRPVPAQSGAEGAKMYALTPEAKFNVGIKITKNYDFRREQEAATLGELIAQAPQLMTVLGDLYLKNLDGPGHDEMAERMKAMLDPKVLAMIESKQSGQEPPSPQLMQAQAQLAELQAIAQQQAQQLETDAVKQRAETERKAAEIAAETEREQMRIAADLEKARMDNATKLQIEEYKLRGMQIQAEIDAREQQLGAVTQAASEDAQREHESVEAERARVAAAEEAERGRQAEAERAAEDRAQSQGEA